MFVETYARSAQVTWLADDQAVCLWHTPDDPGLEWPTFPTVAGALTALVGASDAERVGNALHPISDITPTEPHVYVNFLAVDPAQQGRGAGGRAIAPALDAARARGIGVRLESTNPRNLPFYERLGFRRRAELQLGDGPLLVSLWLDPHVTAQAGSRHIGYSGGQSSGSSSTSRSTNPCRRYRSRLRSLVASRYAGTPCASHSASFARSSALPRPVPCARTIVPM